MKKRNKCTCIPVIPVAVAVLVVSLFSSCGLGTNTKTIKRMQALEDELGSVHGRNDSGSHYHYLRFGTDQQITKTRH